MLTVLRAVLSDVPAIYDLYRQTIHSLNSTYDAIDFEHLVMDRERSLLLVAKMDVELAGILLAFDNVVWAYVDIFYVAKKWRAGGVGKALAKGFLDHTKPKWHTAVLCHPFNMKFPATNIGIPDVLPLFNDGRTFRWVYKKLGAPNG